MASKHVVILATSASAMGDHTTGAWSEEITGPFYAFKDAGCTVTIASVAGGTIPIDAGSLSADFKTANDTRFETDGDIAKLSDSPAIASVDLGTVDCLFLAGGHGTCADFVEGPAPTAVTTAYGLGKVVGAVCHGPMGLVGAKDGDKPLIAGKKVCAFNDVEEGMVGLTEKVPFSLEGKMKELGATYVTGEPWSATAVRDDRLVTGQNPQSSVKCAKLCLQAMGVAPRINQTGSCFCGAVQYKVEGEVVFNALCHCRACARACGTGPVHLLAVAPKETAVTITQGEDAIVTHGDTVTRCFCGRCGTTLHQGPVAVPFRAVLPTTFKIEAGTNCLFPDEYKPQIHCNYENRTFDWCDDLPKFQCFPGDGAKMMDNAGSIKE